MVLQNGRFMFSDIFKYYLDVFQPSKSEELVVKLQIWMNWSRIRSSDELLWKLDEPSGFMTGEKSALSVVLLSAAQGRTTQCCWIYLNEPVLFWIGVWTRDSWLCFSCQEAKNFLASHRSHNNWSVHGGSVLQSMWQRKREKNVDRQTERALYSQHRAATILDSLLFSGYLYTCQNLLELLFVC